MNEQNTAVINKAEEEFLWFTNTDEIGYESLEVLEAAKNRVEMLQLAAKHAGGLDDRLYQEHIEAIRNAYESEKAFIK
jgi:hypothetical protein